MDEIRPEINIDCIRQTASAAQRCNREKLEQEKKENTVKLLENILDHISVNAVSGSLNDISVYTHKVYYRGGIQAKENAYIREIYPFADQQEVFKNLRARGFDVGPSIIQVSGMNTINVKNTWSS